MFRQALNRGQQASAAELHRPVVHALADSHSADFRHVGGGEPFRELGSMPPPVSRQSSHAASILFSFWRHKWRRHRVNSIQAFAILVAEHLGWISHGAQRPVAEHLAHRAVELDESDPWAYMALGYLAFVARQTDEALRRYFAAAHRNPNFAPAYGYAGWAQAHDGRSEAAIENLVKAIRLSPRDPFNVFYAAGFAAAYYTAGRYAEAIEWARQALMLRPGHLGARRKLCASLAQAGLLEEAHTEMARLRELQPNLSLAWIKQSVPYTAGPMERFLEGMRKAGLKD